MVAVIRFSLSASGSGVVRPCAHQRQDVKFGEAFLSCRLKGSLDARRTILVLLTGRVLRFDLHQQDVRWGCEFDFVVHTKYEIQRFPMQVSLVLNAQGACSRVYVS